MLAIDMLPAGKGDCLWIEYGKEEDPHRLLVDGGIPGTADAIRARIESMAPAPCRFELLVLTHIDLDHIGGILDLLRHPPSNLVLGDVWFNGWQHLQKPGSFEVREEREEDDDILGAKQGEALSTRIEVEGYPWNGAFGGKPVVIEEDEKLPRRDFDGGLRLTLLAPMRKRLYALRRVWEEELRYTGRRSGELLKRLGEERSETDEEDEATLGAGAAPDVAVLARSRSPEDTSKANGSSIAFLLEHNGKRCLLSGDAYASDIAGAVVKLAAEEGEGALVIDALKLAHHGGRRNTSVELIRSLVCPRFLFSTNGVQHRHPDPESVARVLMHGRRSRLRPHLYFNYRTERTDVWDDARLLRQYEYNLEYPLAGAEGLRVDL